MLIKPKKASKMVQLTRTKCLEAHGVTMEIQTGGLGYGPVPCDECEGSLWRSWGGSTLPSPPVGQNLRCLILSLPCHVSL